MLPAIFVLAVLAVLVVAHLPAATRGQIRRCRSCIDPRSDGGPRNKCHECIVLPRGAYTTRYETGSKARLAQELFTQQTASINIRARDITPRVKLELVVQG